MLVETLRLALQRERGSFSNFHGGTPIRPLTVVGSEVGAKLKGLDQRFKDLCRQNKKGRYAPLLPLPAPSNFAECTSEPAPMREPGHKKRHALDLYQSALISV